MKASELMMALYKILPAIAKTLDETEAVEEKTRQALGSLAGAQADHATVFLQLQEAKAALAQADRSYASREHLVHKDETKRLHELNDEIAAAKTELSALEAETARVRQAHDAIIQEMRSIGNRLPSNQVG